MHCPVVTSQTLPTPHEHSVSTFKYENYISLQAVNHVIDLEVVNVESVELTATTSPLSRYCIKINHGLAEDKFKENSQQYARQTSISN